MGGVLVSAFFVRFQRIDFATHLPDQARLMEWPCYGCWRIGLLGDGSSERSSLSLTIGRVGQRVIPPRVALNRLVAVETLKRQGHDSTQLPSAAARTASSHCCANTRAESMSRIICECNGTSTT